MTMVERRTWRNGGRPYVRRFDMPPGIDIDDPGLDDDAQEAAATWRQLAAIALARSSVVDGEVIMMSYAEIDGGMHAPFAAIVRDATGRDEPVIVLGNSPDYLSRDEMSEFERLEREAQYLRDVQSEIDRIAALPELTPDQRDEALAEWGEAHVEVFGSGDLYVDLGYVHPRKIRLLQSLARQLAHHTGNGGRRSEVGKQLTLTPAEIAARAHVDVTLVDQLLRGVVHDLEVWDLLRIMMDAGLDIYVDVLPSDEQHGSITV